MSWQDTILDASFRGVPFSVSAEDGVFGRRKIFKEIPGSDALYTADIGRKKREFNIEGFVAGGDYNVQRDRLIAAVEKSGPGELVHPTYGVMIVECVGIRVTHVDREGRMCRFALRCVRSGEVSIVELEPDTPARLLAAATAAMAQAQRVFTDVFEVVGKPQHFFDAAIDAMDSVLLTMQTAKTEAKKSLDYQSTLNSFSARVSDLLLSPVDLVTDLAALIGINPDDYSAIDRMQENVAMATQMQEANTLANTSATADANTRALMVFAYAASAIEASRAVADVTFVSVDSATAARDTICAHIDDLSLSADGAYYVQLMTLRASLAFDVEQRSLYLPRLVSLTLAESTPSLVVAYDLYENASRDLEIVERNRVHHPGFVTGGVALEVLSDA